MVAVAICDDIAPIGNTELCTGISDYVFKDNCVFPSTSLLYIYIYILIQLQLKHAVTVAEVNQLKEKVSVYV